MILYLRTPVCTVDHRHQYLSGKKKKKKKNSINAHHSHLVNEEQKDEL